MGLSPEAKYDLVGVKMKYILGLDQGGTKTVAALADRTGRILEAGYSRGSCHSIHGMEHSMSRVMEAVREVLEKANASIEEVDMIYAGMTGADFPYEYPLLQQALIQATRVSVVTVVNDCIIAYRGGTSSPAGAVLCIGTGTNAAIVSPDGEPFIYGYHINDEDSGGEALGNEAIRTALNSDVGLSPPTALKSLILEHYRLGSNEELMEHWVQGKLGSKKYLAPLLFQAAEAGDQVASGLLNNFGLRNSRYIEIGLKRFGMDAGNTVVVLSGSLFKAQPAILFNTVANRLKKTIPNVRIVNAKYEPVVGAVMMALDHIHGSPYPFGDQPLADSVRRLGLFRLL
jgi:N-acetylglucosamine kinase-like BadF-type ATPase